MRKRERERERVRERRETERESERERERERRGMWGEGKKGKKYPPPLFESSLDSNFTVCTEAGKKSDSNTPPPV